jgi:site-specific DNA recombinase
VRAVAYIRVSDASQVDGYSLNAQERLFRELCKNKDWEPVNVYREERRSAKHDAIARRPVFRQLLEDAAIGAFDIVVVHTLNRWARNLRVMPETLGTLAKHNVTLVSITERVDYTTPQGRLIMQVLGGFAEFYSGSLSTHIKKGVEERARTGLHLGGIPFGYQSCKLGGCDPEHSGGMHLVPGEAGAVRQVFRRYAKGTTTGAQLAAWMNDQGHRTRNMHRMGAETTEPRYFTNSSVRGILHNPFYAGKVKHLDEKIPGFHKGLVSWRLTRSGNIFSRAWSGAPTAACPCGRRPTRTATDTTESIGARAAPGLVLIGINPSDVR